jgi:hypothetical protein
MPNKHCEKCHRRLGYRKTVNKMVCINPSCEEYWTGENKPRMII